MNNPLVSVIIATYRRDVSLKKALESLKKQTYKHFEIILVDDNDNEKWNTIVFSIIDEFKRNNPEIPLTFFQNHPQKGSAQTRNKGIELSKGKYITFLDDDDLYLPNKIISQVLKMEEAKADFSLMNLTLFNENETLCEIRTRKYLKTEESNDLLLCHLKYHMTGTDTMMFKSKYIKLIRGFEPIDIGDEFYLMMKAILEKGKFVYVDSCEVKAYVHTSGGLSSGNGKISGENNLYEFKKKYFNGLKKKDLRYIKMRHHAVLAFAYYRSKKYVKTFLNGCKAVLISPINCFKLIIDLRHKEE